MSAGGRAQGGGGEIGQLGERDALLWRKRRRKRRELLATRDQLERGRERGKEGEGGGRGRREREEGEGGGREVERGEGGEGERGGGKYRRCETREVKKTERMVVHGMGRGKVKQEVGRGKRWEGEEVEVGRTASNISQVMDERMRVWRV